MVFISILWQRAARCPFVRLYGRLSTLETLFATPFATFRTAFATSLAVPRKHQMFAPAPFTRNTATSCRSPFP
ncbi:hypothetical protein L596_001253 [Steinernema carpocapsae]|uniref:Uncharacterized protein n=1 Tax=Steinernema carpocapsae TaxID=34508 RepID=A0A4U8UL92_STECR|nr:hypothetical protein L596_001253 [Steinernema carpocapsae]